MLYNLDVNKFHLRILEIFHASFLHHKTYILETGDMESFFLEIRLLRYQLFNSAVEAEVLGAAVEPILVEAAVSVSLATNAELVEFLVEEEAAHRPNDPVFSTFQVAIGAFLEVPHIRSNESQNLACSPTNRQNFGVN